MFFGRQLELNEMQKAYDKGEFEFQVIYGRRRVGKTSIINEFIKDKAAIYFTGVETNERQNLENFSRCVLGGDDLGEGASFESFQAALEYVFRRAIHERIVLVIDEYPYVAKASKSLASTLQMLIDTHKEESKLFLILCGSSMSYMEDEVLAYKAPLYGRRTAQFKIKPFEFRETLACLKEFELEDKALVYGMLGGTPQYILQVDDNLSVKENMKEIFLKPNAFLFEEPMNLLKQELREPALYHAIVSAIATGYSKMSEISTKVGETTSTCSGYIKNLVELGIVRKEVPYGTRSNKKSIYSIEDNMFRFWYRYVNRYYSIITRGAPDLAYNRIETSLNDYMGPVFEEICKQYLWQELLQGQIDMNILDFGRWWGANPKTKKQEEIDIVGSDGSYDWIFAECKWTNEEVGSAVLDKLVDRSDLFNVNNAQFYIFAKRGFTSGCMEKANEMGNVKLVSYEDIVFNK